MLLDKNYWDKRYLNNETPWDIGYISTPLKDFIDSLNDKHIRILIPGAGKSHEAVYLFQQGFDNVFVCDWVDSAFGQLREQCEEFPKSHLLAEDFFELDGSYDIILEQTFFCSFDPLMRSKYARKISTLLNDKGIFAGLFFASHFDRVGPPFGGTEREYRNLFSPYFDVLEMKIAPNSILPRMGNELFFRMIVRR